MERHYSLEKRKHFLSNKEHGVWNSSTHRQDATGVDTSWPGARRRGLLGGALLATLIIALLSIGVGSIAIPPVTTLKILLARLPLAITPDWPAAYESILIDIRLPRVALVALSGAALACSGAAYQGLFRNPLADPYLIGVAAGAGLGVVLVLPLRPFVPQLGTTLVPLGAFSGALTTVALVYMLGRSAGGSPVTSLVLAGVAVGSMAGAIMTFLLLRSGAQSGRVLAFLLGGYGGAGWDAVLVTAPLVLLGSLALYAFARPLNVLLLDEEQARQIGVNAPRVRRMVIIAATLTTAAAVAFSGLIGFVGLIVPHVARLIGGADHRRLIPLATVGGAGFLMLADLIARTAITPQELPLGVVTALAGAPYFLYLLRRASNQS